jgi:tetratricopeptide (TPR) repeat protein/DNA-directed RNA polymerase subunit RPC12/RpoP
MIITCPKCGKRHKFPEDWSANKVRCSRCGEKFFLDELASEFIAPDEPQKDAAPPPVNSQARKPTLPIRLAVGISSVLVIAGATTFYFFHVVPENKFRQAMREAEEAENAQRWDDALNAYYRAERIKPHDANAENAWRRVEEKRRLAEYAEAMARGKAAEQSSDWATALREYQTALLRKSDDVEAKVCVAEARYQLPMKEGRAAEQQKQWELALIAYSHALAAKPNDAEATEAEQRVRKLRAEDVLKKVGAAESPKSAHTKIEAVRQSQELKTSLEWNRSDASLSSSATATEESAAKRKTVRRILEKSGTEKISIRAIPEADKNAWALARKQEALSGNPAKLYELLGEHLLAADHLLQHSERAQRQKGLAIAVQAARAARRLLNDAELAAAIADAFLLPHVESAADERPYVWLSRDNVFDEAIAAYKLAGDVLRQTAAYQMMLQLAPNRNTADFARLRLAQLCQKEGDHRRALDYLKAIHAQPGGMSGVRRLIPGIEKKLETQPLGGNQ